MAETDILDPQNLPVEDVAEPVQPEAAAPAAAPVPAAEPEIDYRAEYERNKAELEAARQQQEQYAQAFREAEDQRLRMEGMLQASGHAPRAEPTATEPTAEQRQQQYLARIQASHNHIMQTVAPFAQALQQAELQALAVGPAPEAARAVDVALAKALQVEADNPAVRGIREAMVMLNHAIAQQAAPQLTNAMLQRVVAMIAANNVQARDAIDQLSRTNAQQFVSSDQERQKLAQQVEEAFSWVWTTGAPELGQHYSRLGEHAKQGFANTAHALADYTAREMTGNPNATRADFVAWCNQNGRIDMLNDYLARFGKAMKQQLGIADAAPAAPPPARRTAPAAGVLPSARQVVTVPPASNEDEDPVGTMLQEERQWGR